MKIICAFDSFKGSLSAMDACRAAERGLLTLGRNDITCIHLPMSDGGEGLVRCIAPTLHLDMLSVRVKGPMNEPTVAHYAITSDGQTAYMEMAEAAGLTLVPPARRNPMIATTYGVGEMILDAVHRGCSQIVMGIGGSATCDGGRGMVECLSQAGFFEDEAMKSIRFLVASDVANPLCGKNGAARIFAPQKGATPDQVEQLDQRLRDFAIETANLGICSPDIMYRPGAGAAGGLGFALMAYLHATLRPGIHLVLDILDFDRHIEGADLVVTGEGKSDRQTLMGKVAMGVLQRAHHHHIPCHLLSGQIDDREMLLSAGFASVSSINAGDTHPLQVLMQKDVAEENLANCMAKLIC